jgi:F-type H+-transporting ATPase subunit delta
VASATQGLAERYAFALYELADEQKALDEVASDLTALRQLLVDSADFERLVRSPQLSRADQTKGSTAVLEAFGAHALTVKFAGVLAANRRLFALPQVITAFLKELARRRGEVSAEVTSAVALSDDEVQAVTEALRKVVGQKVTVSMSVDPELIGGLVVRVGSRMIDNSLRTKLHRLQLAMKGTG